MLDKQQIQALIAEHGDRVNAGRSIRELIADGELPRLEGATVLEGKVSDSVLGENLVTRGGRRLRLMFRNTRISTHDVNRGAIPFKDQVLALNHAHMLDLVGPILGSSQFEVPNLMPTSTVIPAEDLRLIKFENVLRLFNAESSTSTSLYQHWLTARNKGLRLMVYAGHSLNVEDLEVNGRLPYVIDTPSTKDKEDKTINVETLVANGVCTEEEYAQIRNASLMAFGVVSEYLRGRNMVLVDTKTEHGVNSVGKIVVADEVYTMDSSRFWRLDNNKTLMTCDGKPVSFSKEFAREMVTDKNQRFSPELSCVIATRYILGLQHLLGCEFTPDLRDRDERLVDSTNLILDSLL